MKSVIVFAVCMSLVWARSARVAPQKGRIIGGEPANAGEFPFAAAIYKTTATGQYFCAGALIRNQWVLTSAQCADEATLFSIRLGATNLNDPNAVRLTTDTYDLHPDYDPLTLANDIGLIKFRLPITFTDYIRPVSILSSANLPDYSYVTTFGWGQTSDQVGGLTETLQYVHLVTLSNEECRLTFGNQIFDTMVCVDGNFNQGTCNGDQGSPLIQYSGSSSLIYHVGVSSFISGNGCETTDPSGFTRTSPYVSWINNITSSG